ncbi:hypothetical protein [uncultured Psychroserpens sp.]|uniref:hypothetical protein n=1 Tax=uncultured Psychroserpens sp. TaxID=255436 RepID=UPI0026201071|nr:hypothetical protein [uncultured Psychroserpens sp.]
MLTEQEMLEIAEKFLRKMEETSDLELMLYPDNQVVRKPYGNIYYFDSIKHITTGEHKYAIVGAAPFLVEKEKRRIVTFSTANTLESQLPDYENGTMVPSLHTYWYPDEDRYSHK